MATRQASPLASATSDQGIVLIANEAYVMDVRDRQILTYTTAFSASRAVTLPAASNYAIGTKLKFSDVGRALTSANTMVITRASGDTIGGAAANKTLNAAGASTTLVSDGITNWNVEVDT